MVFVYTYTRYLVDVFFSGIITDENKSEENEISLLSLLEKLNLIKFSSSSSLLTFDFCKKRKVSVAQQTRRIFDKSHHKHSKKTDTKFSLSSLSLCFHDNRTTSFYTL